MKISAWERDYWRKVARDSAVVEEDDPLAESHEKKARILTWLNNRRAQIGMPPLVDEDRYPPELGFYERARARGLLRRPRQGA